MTSSPEHFHLQKTVKNHGALALALVLGACSSDPNPATQGAGTGGIHTGAVGSGGLASGGSSSGGVGNGAATNSGGTGATGGLATGGAFGSGGDSGTPALSYEYGLTPTTIRVEDARASYDAWKDIHLENCEDGAYRVRWENERLDATVSEGIGYGMLLTVIWNDREAFDGLFEYYKRGLNTDTGLMHWLRYGCDAHYEETYNAHPDNAAADADLDVAMALIMAHCKYGDDRYRVEAEQVIAAIRTHMMIEENGTVMLLPGDSGWYHEMGGGCLNYSYFAPAYYRQFANYDAQNAEFWNRATADTYKLLQAGSHELTGLVRNWGSADGENGSCHDTYVRDDYNPAAYGDDAARTPWRVITDYLWTGAPEAAAWTDQVTAWVNTVGIESTVQWYHLDGNQDMGPAGWDDHTAINVGPWATGAMSYDQATVDRFSSELLLIPAGPGDHDGEYFPRMLKALSLATLAGLFTTCGGTTAL